MLYICSISLLLLPFVEHYNLLTTYTVYAQCYSTLVPYNKPEPGCYCQTAVCTIHHHISSRVCCTALNALSSITVIAGCNHDICMSSVQSCQIPVDIQHFDFSSVFACLVILSCGPEKKAAAMSQWKTKHL